MTTWSALGILCTFMSSARSRARWIRTFANVLWPPFLCLSAMQSGCSENFAPHARTVATRLIVRVVTVGDEGVRRQRITQSKTNIQSSTSADGSTTETGLTPGAGVFGATDVATKYHSDCCCCGPAGAVRRRWPAAYSGKCRRSVNR